MPLTKEERESFLAEPHTGALSVARADPGRGPLTVPIWYAYEPGGELWVMTGRDSVKADEIRAAGRFTMMAQRLEPTIRYVSVEGPVVAEDDAGTEPLRLLAERYLAPAKVEPYVRFAESEHGPQVTFRIRPERWLSADLGSV